MVGQSDDFRTVGLMVGAQQNVVLGQHIPAAQPVRFPDPRHGKPMHQPISAQPVRLLKPVPISVHTTAAHRVGRIAQRQVRRAAHGRQHIHVDIPVGIAVEARYRQVEIRQIRRFRQMIHMIFVCILRDPKNKADSVHIGRIRRPGRRLPIGIPSVGTDDRAAPGAARQHQPAGRIHKIIGADAGFRSVPFHNGFGEQIAGCAAMGQLRAQPNRCTHRLQHPGHHGVHGRRFKLQSAPRVRTPARQRQASGECVGIIRRRIRLRKPPGVSGEIDRVGIRIQQPAARRRTAHRRRARHLRKRPVQQFVDMPA